MNLTNNDAKFFPLGLALGNNFCDRADEQKRLINNIKSATATLVTSPRRYGKTSLVLNVLYSHRIPFAYIDLYVVMDEDGIGNTILSGVGEIVYKLESVPKKALSSVTDFFAGLSVSFSFKNTQIKVNFPGPRQSPAKLLLETLRELDSLLQKKNKKAVLFLDEFQRVSEVSESVEIEGALRNVAQQTQNICFVFSGSNRHIICGMFNDRSRPFYNLCDRILLSRIEKEYYTTFIQKKAEKKWAKLLSEGVLEEIYTLSQRYPYYLNVLCNRLWQNDEVPTVSGVFEAWKRYAQEEKSRVLFDLEQLSANQSKMLRSIAKYDAKYQPTSKEFLSLTKFSSSSAVQTLKKLKAVDYLYSDENGKYHLLDPLMLFLFSIHE